MKMALKKAISVILSDFSHLWAGKIAPKHGLFIAGWPITITIRVRKFHNLAHNIYWT